jgi:hypothetical protein
MYPIQEIMKREIMESDDFLLVMHGECFRGQDAWALILTHCSFPLSLIKSLYKYKGFRFMFGLAYKTVSKLRKLTKVFYKKKKGGCGCAG